MGQNKKYSVKKLSTGMSRREFLRTAAAGTSGLAFGTGKLSGTSAEARQKNSGRPNILFITTDEHRYDALGAAGNKVIQTPNLDKLAAGGVRFARTYCQGPLCQPSRASIMTGQYVHQHGQTWNRFDMKPEWPTMMKQLQKSGYFTAKIGKTHFYAGSPSGSRDLRKNQGFVRSFGLDYVLEEFDKQAHAIKGIVTPYTEYLKEKGLYQAYIKETPEHGTPKARVEDNYLGKTSQLSQEHDLTSFIAHKSIEWLDGYQDQKPFFLWISFVAPHPPLIDDPIWAAFYKNKKILPGPRQRPKIPDNAWGRYLGGWLKGIKTEKLTPELLLEAARHYYGMVSLIDQKIGDLVNALERQGREANTWIIFTADHGEMLGDHGLMFKNVFYKGSVLVPNIIHPPGGGTPRVVNSPTQSIDLTATVIDLARAESPKDSRGRTLLPFLEGNGKPREAAFSEMAGHGNRGNFLVMTATDRYRYLYDSQNEIPCELFDLQEDPDELNNLVDDPGYEKVRKNLHNNFLKPFMSGEIG